MTGKLKIRDGIYYAVIYYKDSYGNINKNGYPQNLKNVEIKKKLKEF